jgi:cell wall-associated NlpC family hydrolase
MSLMFALPADAAEPSTLSAQQIQTIVDSHGHTAAQILDVSADVTMPAPQRDNQIAAALTGIVSQEQGGADVATAQAAISNALQYGGARTTIVETALSYLGDPYVLGGASHSGIDCSGLVMVAYAAVGIHLGHLVSDEDGVATPITQAQALPGDIVVFNDEQHIGIYLGNGLLIQAPKPGTPVDIVPVWTIPHHFARILPAGQ